MPLDKLRHTHGLLERLLQDGRRSASGIGRQVGLSPAAAKRRIDRLEQAAIVTGYRAILDHTKLGHTIEAFVELQFEGATQVDDIVIDFTDLPELVEGFTIAGDPDAPVHLRLNNLNHLKDVVDRIRRTGTVVGTKALIVLDTSPGSAHDEIRTAPANQSG